MKMEMRMKEIGFKKNKRLNNGSWTLEAKVNWKNTFQVIFGQLQIWNS